MQLFLRDSCVRLGHPPSKAFHLPIAYWWKGYLVTSPSPKLAFQCPSGRRVWIFFVVWKALFIFGRTSISYRVSENRIIMMSDLTLIHQHPLPEGITSLTACFYSCPETSTFFLLIKKRDLSSDMGFSNRSTGQAEMFIARKAILLGE